MVFMEGVSAVLVTSFGMQKLHRTGHKAPTSCKEQSSARLLSRMMSHRSWSSEQVGSADGAGDGDGVVGLADGAAVAQGGHIPQDTGHMAAMASRLHSAWDPVTI